MQQAFSEECPLQNPYVKTSPTQSDNGPQVRPATRPAILPAIRPATPLPTRPPCQDKTHMLKHHQLKVTGTPYHTPSLHPPFHYKTQMLKHHQHKVITDHRYALTRPSQLKVRPATPLPTPPSTTKHTPCHTPWLHPPFHYKTFHCESCRWRPPGHYIGFII